VERHRLTVDHDHLVQDRLFDGVVLVHDRNHALGVVDVRDQVEDDPCRLLHAAGKVVTEHERAGVAFSLTCADRDA
jgi:hypothetical protein